MPSAAAPLPPALEELPQAAKTIPLDHLEAVFAISAEVAKAKIQQVDNTPPRIIYTTHPSVLVLVDGAGVARTHAGDESPSAFGGVTVIGEPGDQ